MNTPLTKKHLAEMLGVFYYAQNKGGNMSNVKKRKYVFLSNWEGQELKCACLFNNPLCVNHKKCEEIELTLSPYEDLEQCMRERRYTRAKGGAIKQK